MEIVAKKVPLKSTTRGAKVAIVISVILILTGLVLFFVGLATKNNTLMGVPWALVGLGAMILLFGAMYFKTVSRFTKLPENIVEFDEPSGILVLNLSKDKVIRQNIKTITNITWRPMSTRYQVFNYGYLVMTLTGGPISIPYVDNLNAVGARLLILKDHAINK